MTRTIETGTDDLLARVDGNVGIITFNRPERRNALSNGVYHGFEQALPAMALDPEVRVIMVTGAGGAFCAGGDVKGMNEANQAGGHRAGQPDGLDDRIAYLRHRQRGVSLALHQHPKPIVAALPGAAAGAGLSIALAADIRLAAERAIIVTAFANVGASGDFGGSWFLTQLVGPAKAKELYFTSPRLSANEALALGHRQSGAARRRVRNGGDRVVPVARAAGADRPAIDEGEHQSCAPLRPRDGTRRGGTEHGAGDEHRRPPGSRSGVRREANADVHRRMNPVRPTRARTSKCRS